MNNIISQLDSFPIIAALKDIESVKIAMNTTPRVCFILGGDIISAPKMVKALKIAGKKVFVHIDMIAGMGTDKAAVKYVARAWKPDGIITTRKNLIKCAKDEGLMTVQRIFLLDSTSIKSGITMINNSKPDIVEVVPGVISKAITEIKSSIHQQVIAGGMITDIQEVKSALKAGAKGISTSSKEIWKYVE
ncbi:MAG: glycerol-3-phosphate responsive antiterminator [Clostridiales bacterium]|nr:glycerol-3-phosphate responsive antiterminator [Clostridiales bacterium]